jgi:hypothetical protein
MRAVKSIARWTMMIPLCLFVVTTADADPATQPVHPAVVVAREMQVALAQGDTDVLRSLLTVDDPKYQPIADAYVNLMLRSTDLRLAAEEAFTPRAPGNGPAIPSVLPEPRLLTEAGDRAEVLIDPAAPPLVLRRVDDTWKLDLAAAVGPGEQHLDDQVLLLQEMARVLERTTDDIRNGRFATPTDARSILAQRMSELLGRRDLIRTRPTTQPAR